MVVKKLRNKRNWSQDQLATMCGLSIRTIQRIESGQGASLESLNSLASVFEVNIITLTEVITVIDKQSEIWKNLPWWFRAWSWGIWTRKIHILTEKLVFTTSVLLLIWGLYLPFMTTFSLFFMFVLYFHSLCIRYGDNNLAWGDAA